MTREVQEKKKKSGFLKGEANYHYTAERQSSSHRKEPKVEHMRKIVRFTSNPVRNITRENGVGSRKSQRKEDGGQVTC